MSEAQTPLTQEVKKLKLLRLVDQGVTAIKRDAKRGNPAPQTPVKRVDWKCHLRIDLDENAVAKKIRLGSGLVLAINLAPRNLINGQSSIAIKPKVAWSQASDSSRARPLLPKLSSGKNRLLSKAC